MKRKLLKAGALTAPLPPVLVTVGEGDRANIITIGWTGILATHPPRTYVSIRPERHSYGLLRSHGEFVINLTTVKMAREVDYCGIYTGAKVDKFRECGFTKAQSREVSVPSIAECPLSIECRVVEVIPMGTHDVFVADIVAVSCTDEMLDENGRLCFDRAGLLAYAHGEYFALGEKVGSFGFSTKKDSTKKKGKNPVKTDGKPAPKTDGKSVPKTDGKPTSKVDGKPASKADGKPEPRKGTAAKGVVHSKPDGVGKAPTDKAERDDGHRPFYLDAPRGKKNATAKKHGGSPKKKGKK